MTNDLKSSPADRDGAGQTLAVDHQAELDQERQLAEEEQSRANWLSHLFYGKQRGFGTWDGVFTTVVINTFGITVFLRTSWMVANAGVGQSLLILLLGLLLAIIPVLSAIEICERCQIQSGGVYFLVSHVLGGKVGGAVGLIFIFGQVIAGSMVAVGFGESMASLINSKDQWVARAFALGVSVLLLGVNMAGIKWVIRTQMVLLGVLFLAVADFLVGAVSKRDEANGVIGFSSALFADNFPADYEANENFFTVFGVYFSTFTGILSGVNMSGDLKDPVKSIPLGELAGLAVSLLMALAFVISLGAVGDRSAMHVDINFLEKVSLTSVLLLAGIYVSSLSAIINGLYVSPRLLQSMAAENVIAFLRFFAKRRESTNEPIYATLAVALLTVIFIFAGGFNLLAKIATLPYLMMYAFINYSYFSLAMSYDLTHLAEQSSPTKDYGTVYQVPVRSQLPSLSGVFHSIQADEGQSIVRKHRTWYSYLTSRWLALIGAVLNVALSFFINWVFALVILLLYVVLYAYIDRTNPTVSSGISKFNIVDSIRLVLGVKSVAVAREQTIIANLPPTEVKTQTSHVNEGADYAY